MNIQHIVWNRIYKKLEDNVKSKCKTLAFLIAKNLYNTDEFKDTIYITSSEKIKSFTGNKKSFLGKGGVSNPSAMHHMRLDNDSGIGKKSCMAIQLEVEIESFSEKKISIILGANEKRRNEPNDSMAL